MTLNLSAAERNLVLCSLLAHANNLEAEMTTTPGMPLFFQAFIARKIEIIDGITARLEAMEDPDNPTKPAESD